MTSTEGNESHEPSRGLLAGGHPLPSLRPHKNRNCISRSAVMDEHPRPFSPKPGETRTGTPFEIIFGVKGLGQPLTRFLFSLLMRGRSGLHNFRLTAAVRSVMANVTLKLSIGTFSIEVSGPAKYAEKKL